MSNRPTRRPLPRPPGAAADYSPPRTGGVITGRPVRHWRTGHWVFPSTSDSVAVAPSVPLAAPAAAESGSSSEWSDSPLESGSSSGSSSGSTDSRLAALIQRGPPDTSTNTARTTSQQTPPDTSATTRTRTSSSSAAATSAATATGHRKQSQTYH